ncbi:tail fiber domain-containing protein [Paraflavitalea soli]|nr:tail fiber domain-containing protein [Paraflavitalea soli]
MKNLLLFLLLAIVSLQGIAQNVGIGTTTPDASAALDIKSTKGGLLIPAMSQAQRNTISLPATGLLIFQTDGTAGFYYNSGSTTTPAWVGIGGNSGWQLGGNSGTNPAINFIGTADNQPLVFKVNSIRAGYTDSLTYNTGWGFRTMESATTGNFNTAIGYKAMVQNADGLQNAAVGANSLRYNISGSRNSALGMSSLGSNTTGNANVAIGNYAMASNISGGANTANGYYCMTSNTTGGANTASGSQTLLYNTTGFYNTAFGYQSMFFSTTGSNNTAIGSSALYSNETGSKLVALGDSALMSNITGFGNVAIGASANVATGNLQNAVAIGYNTVVNASNKIRLGNSLITVIEGQVPYTFPSDGRFKTNIDESVKGLDFIMQLRPVVYNFQSKKYDEFTSGQASEGVKFIGLRDYSEAEKVRHNGFIAQEVEEAARKAQYEFDGVVAPRNNRETYGLSYSQFVVPLVKAVQEQQRNIAVLEKENADLKKRIEKLEALIINK